MKKPTVRPLDMEDSFIDFNGNLTDHRILHNEENNRFRYLSADIVALFRKQRVTDTEYPVVVANERYPEYSRKDITQFYDEKGISVQLYGRKKLNLLPDEDDAIVYIYHTWVPFWYIIYMYCSQEHVWGLSTAIEDFKKMTKQELKKAFDAANDSHSTYVNHDVFMLDLSTWSVYNIGW